MSVAALYLDFNSYFASVEQQLRPELRGKPVAVLPVMAETTCCIAASYEAKAWGVKTGTTVREAKRMCPDLVCVEARHVEYVKLHHQLVAAIDQCTPVAEVRSIDELWSELTGTWQDWEVAEAKAWEIKRHIRETVGEELTSSIGIAPNWFLAKIASNMQKPNGLTIIEEADIPDRLFGLELSDIYGIGHRTEMRMHDHGIHTVEQLYAASREQLHKVYNSIHGERLYDLLRGRRVYQPPSRRASIGHSHVLPPRLRNEGDALAVMHRLLQKAMMRLRKMGNTTGELGMRVNWRDGSRDRRRTRFSETDDTRVTTTALNALWQQRPERDCEPTAVGIVLNELYEEGQSTRDLFEPPRRPGLNRAVDKLNARYGKNAVYFGGAAGALDEAPMRIAFTQIPDVQTER